MFWSQWQRRCHGGFEHWNIFNKDSRLQINTIFSEVLKTLMSLWVGVGTPRDLKALDCPSVFQICTQSRRCVYSWWSSGWFWTSWETFLELPNAWRRLCSRHRHDGKTNGQWPPSGMRGNNQRNCRSLQQLWDGVFQYGISGSLTLMLRGEKNACFYTSCLHNED